jgi:hypothetical protein
MAVAAPAAHAGEYAVNSCPAPTAPLQNWTANTEGAGGLASTRLVEGCAQGTQPITIDGSGNQTVNSGSVEWQFRTPAESVIVDWNAEAAVSTTSPYTYIFLVLNNGGKWGVACGPGGTFNVCGTRTLTTQRDRPAAGSTVARFAMQCQPQGSATTCEGPTTAALTRNILTLRDDTGPTGEVTGTLVSSGFGSPIGGTATADFVASDSGAGVRRVEVRIDGSVVGATASQCDPPFTGASPCPGRVPGSVTADLSKVGAGTHSLQVVAIDAAGAEGVLKEAPVVVRNGEAVGPGGDGNLRGAPNGSYGADDGRITAWWPATGRAPSRSKAVQRKCKRSASYRRKNALRCSGRAPSRRLSASFSSKRENLIRGRLTNAAGQPIAGATVSLVGTAAGRATEVARPVTDATGAFEAKTVVRTGSTQIAVTWAARAGDSIPAAATTLSRKVKAASTFRADRLARPGKRLSVSGRLLGQSGSQDGVPILIQISAGEGWRAATTVQARGDGRWRARYSVPRQLRGTYRLRAVVKPTSRYPYTTSATRSRPVTIR